MWFSKVIIYNRCNELLQLNLSINKKQIIKKINYSNNTIVQYIKSKKNYMCNLLYYWKFKVKFIIENFWKSYYI